MTQSNTETAPQETVEVIEGTVQGFTCVTLGKVCPIGAEDPMAAIEDVFVILLKTKKYYFVPNLDRVVMARHINERVRVSGKISPGFNAIMAREIEVFKNGRWLQTWSLLEMEKIYEFLMNGKTEDVQEKSLD